MTRFFAALVLALPFLTAAPAMADDPWQSYTLDASYDDVAFELKTAIEGRGFVVDNVSHVGEMLNRTAADVGAKVHIFLRADTYQFCSAVVSRKVMEVNPMNIAFCPYGIFIFEKASEKGVTIGYRRMPEGEMQEVDALLHDIVREAAGLK